MLPNVIKRHRGLRINRIVMHNVDNMRQCVTESMFQLLLGLDPVILIQLRHTANINRLAPDTGGPTICSPCSSV